MSALLKAIFQPKDGTRERVKQAMAVSQDKMERASARFESTVRELLERNDEVTGRAGRVAGRHDDDDFH